MSTIEKALQKQREKNQQESAEQAQAETQDTAQASSSPAASATQETQPREQPAPAPAAPKALITIDQQELREKGLITDSTERQKIKDEFRYIKRKLLNNAFGQAAQNLENGNLVMVSSGKPNEGKTFISINLALSIALEQDKTVLLIDADVIRPSISAELNISPRKGLVEYLLGEVPNVSEVIYNTSISNLKIIPAGEPHHLTSELLASDKMRQLTQELANRYSDRMVIFDSPPLIEVNESQVLANLMGQALVVVEESQSKIADIQKAVDSLDEDLAIGFVINKAVQTQKDMYGYYGY
ncbi:polysaccharide biosynthesis tyrosine autokinase [Thalassomonas viridans]|uniref:non-specific protein-tyrosine kinase n=1 Tax=Thalassomonas viridans TaxID=137584 RepID=A0AAF0C9A1_9GAMM|nr:XrtA-associated tyrosine autokinase [Thalassomonas viridans]WDE05025.1 polysaccharide biosynthesis tyrosine autokinase [Thalassomonas viridans]